MGIPLWVDVLARAHPFYFCNCYKNSENYEVTTLKLLWRWARGTCVLCGKKMEVEYCEK